MSPIDWFVGAVTVLSITALALALLFIGSAVIVGIWKGVKESLRDRK